MQDEQVIATIRAGDRDAYGELMQRYQRVIFALCYRITGNRADAEDLAHETFVEAYLKLAQLRDPARFGSWLRAIALNLCRAWFRKRERLPLELLPDFPDDLPERTNKRSDRLLRMSNGLACLSPAHRLTLALYYGEGLSYEELAKFLGIPTGTVMSRLHRARNELKKTMEAALEEDRMSEESEEEFMQVVNAELNVLMELSRDDPGVLERLSVLFERAPERFLSLLRDTTEEASLHSLALLLRRLGRPAVEMALQGSFSTEEPLRQNARLLLCRWIAGSRSIGRKTGTRTAGREIYLLLDVLRDSPADDGQKCGLLLELLSVASDEETALLLTNTLMCFRENAFQLLMERFQAFKTTEEMFRSSDILFALCRTGTQFGGELLKRLHDDSAPLMVTLSGLEALVRSIYLPWLEVETASDDRILWQARFQRKWPPPLKKDRDPAVIASLLQHLEGLLNHADAPVRNAALRIMGLLPGEALKPQIHHALEHPDSTTRVAAIRAASDRGDLEAVPYLLKSVREEGAVRLAALDALGRFLASPAEPLVIEVRRNGGGQLSNAAVSVLGQREPAVRETLEALAATGAGKGAQAAANALRGPFQYQAKKTSPPVSPENRPYRTDDRIREGAEPLAFIALEAAIRALPEIRPYEERELTRLIAQVCYDYSATRRYLIEEGLMTRERGIYRLTESGEALWRVETFIRERYMGLP